MNERNNEDIRSVYQELNRNHLQLRDDLLAGLPDKPPARRQRSIGEIIMRSKLTKLAAAAAILLAIGIGATFLMDGAATPAYAIEQTIEANLGVRSIHIRITPLKEGSMKEAWATFGQDGEPQIMRMEYPDSNEHPNAIIWQQGKARTWWKSQNMILVMVEGDLLEQLKNKMEYFDPKVAMEKYYRQQEDGDVVIETVLPSDPKGPIKLIITTAPEPTDRDICLIDPETKLLIKREKFILDDGEYVHKMTNEYLDYNRKIDPQLWELDVPDDVMVVDQTVEDVGLSRGDATPEEVAVAVVREFFKAMIDGDYSRAGQMYGGIPESKLKAAAGKNTMLRIISIGQPKLLDRNDPGRPAGTFSVPCVVEMSDGEKTIEHEFSPWVGQVYNRPDRWAIFGSL